MRIELKKFGTVLTSRQLGKEASLGYMPNLDNVDKDEIIEIDFEGVETFSPSWGDEFLTPLSEKFGSKIILTHTQNPSVKVTLEVLDSLEGKKFNVRN